MHKSVVGPYSEQALDLGRLVERRNVAVHRRALLVGNGVEALNLAHYRNLVAVQLARQVARNGRPGITAVGALEHHVGCKIERLGIVRTDQQRSVPIPPPGRTSNGLDGLDVDPFARLFVEALKAAVLGLSIHNVGIVRINLRFKSVARLGYVPIAVHNAAVVDGAARTPQREVVLGSAINAIKRECVVYRDAVKLGDGQVVLVVPARGVVPGLVHAAVAAHEEVLGIARVLPKGMVVDVLVFLAKALERSSAVFGPLRVRVHAVHHVGVVL